MIDTARQRLIGALVLIGILLLLAECLPEPELLEPASVDEVTGVTVAPRQRVIYDLRAPPASVAEEGATPESSSPPVPATPAPAPKPRINVLPLNPAAGWYVQLGTYASKKNAQAVLARMQGLGQTGQVQLVPPVPQTKAEIDAKTPPPRPLYRVRIGPYASIELARPAQTLAVENGFTGAQKIEVR